MAEMSVDQQRAMAMAAARLRLQQQQPSEVEAPVERQSYAASDVPLAALKNTPASAAKFATGIATAVLNPIDTLGGLFDVGAGALRNSLPQGVVAFIDKFDSDPEAAKRVSAAASAVGGMYKDRYGDYESIKRTFAEDPVGAAADLSTLLTGGGAAAGKLGMTQTANVMGKTGAAINPLRPVAVATTAAKNLGKGAAQVTEAVFNPKNALYMRSAEGRAPEIINALRQSQEIVPGSAPTAAQAAADTGVVGFQKMGKSASRELETAYRQRAADQAAAQVQAVRGVGKTPEAIAQVENTRAGVTGPMYQKADATLSKVDAEFTDLLSRPSMNQVMARAQKLAAEKDMSFQIGKTTPEIRTPSALVDEAGMPLGETVTPAQFAQLPGTSVHFIKQAFDDLVNDPATFGIGKSEANAIKGTRAEFLKWAEQTNKNPMYGQARETFAKMSEPINQMQIGQFLEGKLKPALGEETARLRATGYSNALEQAPSTIKKATGESRFKTLEDAFKSDKQALDDLYAVREDLARMAKSENLAKGEVKPELDVRKASEVLAGDAIVPNLINRVTTVANHVWRKMRGKIDQNTAVEVATEMLFPGKAADALAKAYAQQQRRQVVGNVLNAPFENMYTTPAMVNMLAPAQQNQNRNAMVK